MDLETVEDMLRELREDIKRRDTTVEDMLDEEYKALQGEAGGAERRIVIGAGSFSQVRRAPQIPMVLASRKLSEDELRVVRMP